MPKTSVERLNDFIYGTEDEISDQVDAMTDDEIWEYLRESGVSDERIVEVVDRVTALFLNGNVQF